MDFDKFCDGIWQMATSTETDREKEVREKWGRIFKSLDWQFGQVVLRGDPGHQRRGPAVAERLGRHHRHVVYLQRLRFGWFQGLDINEFSDDIWQMTTSKETKKEKGFARNWDRPSRI